MLEINAPRNVLEAIALGFSASAKLICHHCKAEIDLNQFPEHVAECKPKKNDLNEEQG